MALELSPGVVSHGLRHCRGGRRQKRKKKPSDVRTHGGAEVLEGRGHRLPLEEVNQSLGGMSYSGHDVVKPESRDQCGREHKAGTHSRASEWFWVEGEGRRRRSLGSVTYRQSYRAQGT